MRGFVFTILVLTTASLEAREKPPLMPKRIVDPHVQAEASVAPNKAKPTRLGLQVGAVGMVKDSSQPLVLGEAFVGGRLFSRLAITERLYFMPSVGYYRLASERTIDTVNPNLLELGAGLHYALFKLGPVGVLAGISQRAGWRFTSETGTLRGRWYYRVGPAVTANIRVSGSMSILLGTEFDIPLSKPTTPEWAVHSGVLFAL